MSILSWNIMLASYANKSLNQLVWYYKTKLKKTTLCTAVHKDGIDDFHEHLNRQNADMHTVHQGDRRKLYDTFSRLLGHSRQQQTTNDYLQKNDTYRPFTRPVFVQPDLSQSCYYPDFDETSATSLRLTWQPTRRVWLS